MHHLRVIAMGLLLILPIANAAAQDEEESGSPAEAMTLERIDELIRAAADEVSDVIDDRVWQFTVAEVSVTVVTDPNADRMRAVAPVAYVKDLDPGTLQRVLQANFDTALDARYAIAQEILWAVYIHPLSRLSDAQFLSGVGQTVNLARTFGSTYSSGELTFGAGDSNELLERELIDELLKRGGVI
jgi:hypothetical protein